MADKHMEQSGGSAEARTPSTTKLLGGGCGGAIIGAVLGALPGICVLVLALSAEPLEPNPDYTVDGTATVALLLI